MTFGELLRRARRSRRMTQRELGEALDHHASLVSRLETGRRRPSHRQFVLDLARALALSSAEATELMSAAGFAPASPGLDDRLALIDERLHLVSRRLEDMETAMSRVLDARLVQLLNQLQELRGRLSALEVRVAELRDLVVHATL